MGYRGIQALLDYEARTAMADGNFVRAWHFFSRLLQINPDDARALREAGRCSHALGDFTYAERALGRAHRLRRRADPELHYLRGQALMALQRADEAEREFAQAERELPRETLDRPGAMWLARILSVRGDLGGAEALLLRWLPKEADSPEAAEIMMARSDAYITVRDWIGAERVLRQLLRVQPEHVQARETLAWVLESRREISAELVVRAELADEWGTTDRGGRVLRYARALERSHDYAAARDRYREAAELGIDDLDADIARMAHRAAVELAAGVVVSGDPTGSVQRWTAGASIPVTARLRLAITGTDAVGEDGSTPAATAMVARLTRGGALIAGGGAVHRQSVTDDVGAGAIARIRSRPGAAVELHASGELAMPWTESAATLREGGSYDALGAHLYTTLLDRRIVLGIGARARNLRLAGADSAQQLLGIAGVDVVVHANPQRAARGEVLDDEMLVPSGLADSVVVSYRRYQLRSDAPFGARLVLVERSAVDELSAVARQTLASGRLAVELRGGLGHDWDRDAELRRVGGSLLLSAMHGSRLSLGYDTTTEITSGLTGRRHSGWINLHVDL